MKQQKKDEYKMCNNEIKKNEKVIKKGNTPFIVLWIVFALMIFWEVGYASDMNSFYILAILSVVMSIKILTKNKMPSKKYRVISAIFMILVTVSYLGYQLNPFILIYGLRSGIPTLFSSLAVFSVVESYGIFEIITKKNKYSLLVTIIIGVVSGIILAIPNTLLGLLSGNEINFEISFSNILICLSPAIFEEMACRAIFMAYCIYYVGENKMNRFQVFTMFFMMCMPHTVAHGYGLIETIILCLLFGVPFTILQRKRDITSAMISHGIVDVIRFMLFGI